MGQNINTAKCNKKPVQYVQIHYPILFLQNQFSLKEKPYARTYTQICFISVHVRLK